MPNPDKIPPQSPSSAALKVAEERAVDKALISTQETEHKRLCIEFEKLVAERDAAKAEVERLKICDECFGLKSAWDNLSVERTKHNNCWACKLRHQRDDIANQLTAAHKALEGAREALYRPIQGCAMKYYMNQQFPATIGHKPFEDWYKNQQEALTAIEQVLAKKDQT